MLFWILSRASVLALAAFLVAYYFELRNGVQASWMAFIAAVGQFVEIARGATDLARGGEMRWHFVVTGLPALVVSAPLAICLARLYKEDQETGAIRYGGTAALFATMAWGWIAGRCLIDFASDLWEDRYSALNLDSGRELVYMFAALTLALFLLRLHRSRLSERASPNTESGDGTTATTTAH